MAFISIFVVYAIALYLNHNGQRTYFPRKREKQQRKQCLVKGDILESFRDKLGLVCNCGQLAASQIRRVVLENSKMVVSLWFIWDIIQTLCEEDSFPMDPARSWQIKRGGK